MGARDEEDLRSAGRAVQLSGATAATRIVVVVLVAAAIAGVYQVIRTVNPIDWVVYRYASSAAWSGIDVYTTGLHGPLIGQPDGMPFTYPPFAAVVLWPTNLGDLRVGALCWTFLSVLMVLALVELSTPKDLARRTIFVLAAWIIACATTIVSIHLSFGQINVVLAVMVLLDIGRPSQAMRYLPRGALVGIAAAIKLTPLVFFGYLAVTRQWRALGVASMAFVGATAVGFAVAPRMSVTFWTDALWSLDSTVALGTGLGSPSNSSLVGLAATLGIGEGVRLVAVAAVAIAGAWAARTVFRSRGHFAGVVVMGLIGCLVSPVSWIHHWVYLIPAAVIIWCDGRTRSRVAVAVAAVICIVTWPRAGERLLENSSVWLSPLGWGVREMLVLMGVAAIIVLCRPPPDRDAETTNQTGEQPHLSSSRAP